MTFTLGNAPKTDLIATSPSGKSFRMECKTMSRRSSWILGLPPEDEDLYFVFVVVPTDNDPSPIFYIMRSNTVRNEIIKEWEAASARGARSVHKFKEKGRGGFPFRVVENNRDRWDLLPQ